MESQDFAAEAAGSCSRTLALDDNPEQAGTRRPVVLPVTADAHGYLHHTESTIAAGHGRRQALAAKRRVATVP